MTSAPGQAVPADRFRILTVDGGGIRGLIPALVITEIEKRLAERVGGAPRVSDYFHLFAGTSTGGLVALGLTTPDPEQPSRPLVPAADLPKFYVEDGPEIFSRSLWQRLRTLDGFTAPKYALGPLRAAVERRLGTGKLGDALRDLVITAYDMTAAEPYFFKRWRALESPARNRPITDAALATSAAPTYFPSHEVDGHALVDGGVFAGNPVVAAIVEALKRRSDPPSDLSPDDLLVVSCGTGLLEHEYSQSEVGGWGRIGWVWPHRGEPPVLGTVLGGASDGADHWAHVLLNHPQDQPGPEDVGRGPRYFRLQTELTESIGLDDASHETIQERLPAAANRLMADRAAELDEIVDRLVAAGPIS